MILNGVPTKGNELPAINTPVAALAAVLKEFPTADLAGHICTSTSTLDKNGLTHIVLLCELTCESPSTPDVCKLIMKYLNQNNWLNNPKTTCSSKRYDLTLLIVGL